MKPSLIFLLLFIHFSSIAQKNFRPGYIVSLQGDTISGFIDHKEWGYSPTRLLFKTATNNAGEKFYGINDLSSFNINGLESYRRSIVKISLHPVKLEDIGSRDTTWKTDTVFLKMLHYGKPVSLLSYTDKLKERFYILEEGENQPVELVMREYLQEGTTSMVSEKAYKGQLISLLNRKETYTSELGKAIEETAYDEADLKKMVGLINGAGGKDQAKEKSIRHSYWFAGLGLQKNGLTFNGDHIMARHPNSSQSDWLPRITAGIDLFTNPAVGKSSVRIEAGYQVNKSSITTIIPGTQKAVYSLSSSSFSLGGQFNYALYNSGKVKIPVGAGVLFSYINVTKNQYKTRDENGQEANYAEDWLKLKKSTTNFFGRASVVFNNTFELCFVYIPPVSLTTTIAYGVDASSVQLQLYYLFRKM